MLGKGQHKRLYSCYKERTVLEQLANQCTIKSVLQFDEPAFAEDCVLYSCVEKTKKLSKIINENVPLCHDFPPTLSTRLST